MDLKIMLKAFLKDYSICIEKEALSNKIHEAGFWESCNKIKTATRRWQYFFTNPKTKKVLFEN